MSREYHFPIVEGLARGLRQYDYNSRNSQLLTQARNVLVGPFGLRALEDLTSPFKESDGTDHIPSAIAFPFPQIFVGENITLLAYANAIYSVDTTTEDYFEATKLAIFNVAGDAEAIIPTSTEPWHFVDLKDYWMLTNPDATVYKFHKEGVVSGGVDLVKTQSNVQISTACTHKGRILIGGFESSPFWSASWTSLWTYWLAKAGANYKFDATIDAPGENFVMWSSIGGGDVPQMLFDPDYFTGFLGVIPNNPAYNDEEPYVMQLLKRNELGWVPIPFQGRVQVLKPLGDNVVAYSENGVTLLTQVSEPYPTFGVVKLLGVGVQSRSVVAGDAKEHVFLAKDGKLYRLSGAGAIEELGYKECFSSWITDEDRIMASFQESDRKYFFSGYSTIGDIALGGEGCYVLTRSGMSSMGAFANVISISELNGTVGAIAVERGVSYDWFDVVVQTDVIDLGKRGLKQIMRVELGLDSSNTSENVDFQVYVSYRDSRSGSFSEEGPYKINDEGVAFPEVTGSDFKIKVVIDVTQSGSGNSYDGFKLDYMNIWYQIVDKRYVRGL